MQRAMCSSGSFPMVTRSIACSRLRVSHSRIVPRAMPPRPTEADPNNPLDQAAKQFEDNIATPVSDGLQNVSGINADSFNVKGKRELQDAQRQTFDSNAVGAIADTMSFAGLAPEIINGRAAMIGMLTAFGAEFATGDTVMAQVHQAPGAVAAAFATVIIASLIPILRGANLKVKGAGPFNTRAEVWNGRLAMLAFASLLIVEGVKNGPGLIT